MRDYIELDYEAGAESVAVSAGASVGVLAGAATESFAGAAAGAFAGESDTSFLPNLFWNFSTRPALSIILCSPVKKGWHLAHTSREISSLRVERISYLPLPQKQVAVILF